MTEREFVFWLKGYLKNESDHKIKRDILEMIDQIDSQKTNINFQTSGTYPGTVKWINTNADLWFNTKMKDNGPADHLS